jgi:serine/threonine protein kinase
VSFPEQPPIPGYEPVRPLGINLGELYLARHSHSGALVTLIVWSLEFAEHARELHAPTARLRHHPNIIRVYGIGEFERSFFCALEYHENTIADGLREGPFPDLEVARLARAIGSALQYARDQGMTAASLSPTDILLTDDHVPKLTSFCAIETFGKPPNLPWPALMPPELMSGEDLNEAGEVHRIGALMYEMLTARPPFEAHGAIETLFRVLHETPEPPRKLNRRVGRDVDAVCMKCLEKHPTARYVSLWDLLRDLKSFES